MGANKNGNHKHIVSKQQTPEFPTRGARPRTDQRRIDVGSRQGPPVGPLLAR